MKPSVLHCFLGFVLAAGIFAAGCNSPATAVCAGTVSVDGQLVRVGEVEFSDLAGKFPPVRAVINNGVYRADDVPHGRKLVRITGSRKIGERAIFEGDPRSPKKDILEPMVPPEFNEKSTLECEVNGNSTLNFELKSTS